MNQFTVIICDDAMSVHESLRHFLQAENIRVISVYNGTDLLNFIQNYPVDLIILDIMLPDISGIELCRNIRQFQETPILFLSAKGEEIDRIIGLELGANDYVTKPFSPREVTLRVMNLLAHMSSAKQASLLHYHELTLNLETYQVFVNHRELDFTAKEIRLLAYLMQNLKKVLSREQILHAVWPHDCYCDTRAVDAVIKRIRQKLPTENVSFTIQAVYGAGFRLTETGKSK